MVFGTIGHSSAGSIDDISYLARAEHRIPMLVALTDRPRSRSELWELTGVSSSTLRRTLREFEGRNWIRRDGYQYETTELGAFVASVMEELLEQIETERALRDVWHYLPGEQAGFTLEMASSAVVTVADADDPYAPVNRFRSLLEGTTDFRFVGSEVALMEPCMDALLQVIDDGGNVELIDRPNCAEYFFSKRPERSRETMKLDNVTVLEHEDLPPYGVGLFDDRIAISCYDQESGTVQVLVDTDTLATREWAKSTYESYRGNARPLETEQFLE